MTDTNRPEVLLSAADHWEDIKIRWQIHQLNHLIVGPTEHFTL